MGKQAIAIGVVVAAGLGFGAWTLLGGAADGPAPDTGTEDASASEAAAGGAGLTIASKPKPLVSGPAAYHAKGKVVDAAGNGVAGIRVTARRTGHVWDASDPKTWGNQVQ